MFVKWNQKKNRTHKENNLIQTRAKSELKKKRTPTNENN